MSQFERRVRRLEQRAGGMLVEICPYPLGDLSPARKQWLEDALRRGVVVIPLEAAGL